jgi:hypothetical protein
MVMNFSKEPQEEVITINKRGDGDSHGNYRGLALGNAAYKILSNIML